MGAENYIGFQPEPPPSKDELETLALSDHQSAIAASVSAAVDAGDPLLTPPPTMQIPATASFIDPPSYSDAVSAPSTSTPKRSHSAPYLKISVTDPRKEHDAAPASLVPGSATYVTYLISSKTRDISEFRVRRRFRDFVTLADRIADSHRGLFVPPRPDKNTVESQMMQRGEFVEQRRVQLEKYLWRLAVHPVVGRSEELRVFLSAQGKLPLAASTDVASRMLDGAVRLPRQLMGEGAVVVREEVVQPAKGGRDLLRIFKELKQSVTNDWGGVRPAMVEEDREFLDRKEKMQDLEHQLTVASQQVCGDYFARLLIIFIINSGYNP